VSWAKVRLVDDDDKDITEPNHPGQIAIQTSCQFVGYWKQPDLTARALRDGWYFPGDMFEFDAEGRWCHLGRADDMLKVSGQWVSPAEIEACALTVPDVMDAAVVGFPNEDGLTRIALFVMPRQSRRPTSRRWSRPCSQPSNPHCRSTSVRVPYASSMTCRARPPARRSASACAKC
jgi:acyl-coenzyme A synthetase/AMP-(fatty) acid ligase